VLVSEVSQSEPSPLNFLLIKFSNAQVVFLNHLFATQSTGFLLSLQVPLVFSLLKFFFNVFSDDLIDFQMSVWRDFRLVTVVVQESG
jgi:hypothetical protein